MEFLQLFTAVICLLFAGAFIVKRENEGKWAGLFFFLKGTRHLLRAKINGTYLIPSNEFLNASISMILVLLILATLYFFFNTYLHKRLPRLLAFIWGLLLVAIIGISILDYYKGSSMNTLSLLEVIVSIFTTSAYIWLLFQIRKYMLTAEAAQLSQYQSICLYWGKWFLYISVISILITVIVALLIAFYLPAIASILQYCSTLIQFIIISLFGYLVIRNANAFNKSVQKAGLEQTLFEIVLPTEEKTPNASKIILSVEQMDVYKKQLQQKMSEEKVYLDEKLTLRRLAELTRIPAHHLTYLLNNEMNSSFYDYLNGFRIEHAKKLLTASDKADYTVYAVALESGFASEKTFYRIFKQYTGLTANQYRESLCDKESLQNK